MDTVETRTAIEAFTLCFLPDCFVFCPSSLSHTFLFQEYFLYFPFAGVAVLREACMSAARVQVNQYQWANTNTHTHTHGYNNRQVSHTYKLAYTYSIWRCAICTTTYFTHRLVNKHCHTHQVLGGDTCVSACSYCCPLGCAVLHTVFTACLPSETKHLWTSILQEWYTADAEDIPLGTQRCLLYNMLTLLYLFDSKVVIVPTFLNSQPHIVNILMDCP